MNEVLLELRGLSRSFGDRVAVGPLDLAIHRGELFCLVGASGCGKSTLLRLLAGLEPPDAGRILFEGRDITDAPPHLRPLNLMFQSYALFPHLSVRNNIAFGLRQARLAPAEIAQRVEAMLALLHLEDCADRHPRQISGGQRQRVALARALARRPPLLLLDEPLGALDRKLREATREELRRLQAELGTTFVLVTHDQEEALSLATRMAVMSAGHLLQIGTPHEIYTRPARREVAEFLGRVNLIEAVVDRCTEEQLDCSAAGGLALRAHSPAALVPGESLHLALRPESIRLSPSDSSLNSNPHLDHGPDRDPDPRPNHDRGVVTGISYLGNHSLLAITGRSHRRWLVQVGNDRATQNLPAVGDDVGLSWDTEAMVVLGA